MVARSADQYRGILESGLFPRAETKRCYYTILRDAPNVAKAKMFKNESCAPDDIRLIGGVIYTLCNAVQRPQGQQQRHRAPARRLRDDAHYSITAKLVELSGV